MSDMPLLVSDIHGSQRFALAQAAGRAGIPVIGAAPHRVPWAERSRYVQRLVRTPDSEETLPGVYASALKRAGVVPAVWLPSYDGSADFTVHYAPFLQQVGLRFLVPDHASLEQRALSRLQAYQGGIRIPFCRTLPWETLAQQADDLPYPLLLKTVRNQYALCRNAAELRAHVDRVSGEYDEEESVQAVSYVPGETSR
ncbi:MAG TPA: hypothetical protein VJ961_08430, partial [Mariprofundaceae bacterium]|nr:hypothetical protein [Mariprofundaceae bacterium]